jgi:hypothetical protein
MAVDYLKIDVAYLSQQIDRLIAAYPELQEDEALRADVLDGETELNEVISRALDHALEAESMAEAIKGRMGFMSERMARYAKRAEAMRGLILELMTKANLRSLPLPEATIAVSAGRDSVIITDLNALPQGTFKTERIADKTSIAAQIKAGSPVPGAETKAGADTLRISRK